jgi:hypothetical protein
LVALAMGRHPRLGAAAPSKMANLPDDVMRQIARFLRGVCDNCLLHKQHCMIPARRQRHANMSRRLRERGARHLCRR